MGILTHTTQHMEVPILPCTSPPGAFAQMVSSTQNVLLIRPSQLGQKGPSKISSAGTGHGFTCAPRAVWAITTALARLRVDCTSSHSPGNTSAAEIMSKSFCHTAGRWLKVRTKANYTWSHVKPSEHSEGICPASFIRGQGGGREHIKCRLILHWSTVGSRVTEEMRDVAILRAEGKKGPCRTGMDHT